MEEGRGENTYLDTFHLPSSDSAGSSGYLQKRTGALYSVPNIVIKYPGFLQPFRVFGSFGKIIFFMPLEVDEK